MSETLPNNTLLRILLLRKCDFWGRRAWLRRLTALVYLYVGVFILLLWLENRLLHPGATFARFWKAPPADLSVQEFDLTIAGGDRVTAWFTAPPGWRPDHGAVLYSHGNGGNLSTRAKVIAELRRHTGRAVLGHDYPGYGKSDGAPTEAGCYASGDAAYEWLVREQKVSPGEIILVGESLGGGVAVDLASRRENRMLVTLATFTSFPDMAQFRFPWLPARYFVRNNFDNERKIAEVRSPVLIAHGTADVVIPYWQGERLAAAATGTKRFVTLDSKPHYCLCPELFQAMKELLEETAPTPGRKRPG